MATPTPPSPDRSGFDARVYHLARHLARRNAVTVLCKVTEEDEDAVAELHDIVDKVCPVPSPGRSRTAKRRAQALSILTASSFELSRQRSAAMQVAIDRLLHRERFDVIQVESAQMGGFRYAGASIILLDEHNVEYELASRMWHHERSMLRRIYSRQEAAKLRRAEIGLWARVDGCAVTSLREQKIVLRDSPSTTTAVVPNGVDLSHFVPTSDKGAVAYQIVFTGTMNYRPNVDAVIHFAEDVLPTVLAEFPDASFTIVGQQPPAEVVALAGPRIRVTGRVADVRPYLASAAVVVAPLGMGSGTRLKILEALACGRPVVSTTVGCEGLELRDGVDLLIADGAQAFAHSVGRVFRDRQLAQRLSETGRRAVEQHYGWDSAAESLDELHSRLTASHAAA